MTDFTDFKSKFPEISCENLCSALIFLKNAPEYDFDMLHTIVAVDLIDKIELNYVLFSSARYEFYTVKLQVAKVAPSVVSVFKSAHFDECEIYDLFGINFDGNKDLKRLLMPETWIGHPLLKSYELNDERLAWNE